MRNIGKQLKECRKKCGYSQQEMSRLLDMAINSYGSYERNNSIPSIENFVKLAEILHTSVQYIVTGEKLSDEFEKGTIPFPQRLRELREKRSLTQVMVANALDIKEVTYQHYEYGAYEPKLDKLIKLAELFNVTLDELMGRNRK